MITRELASWIASITSLSVGSTLFADEIVDENDAEEQTTAAVVRTLPSLRSAYATSQRIFRGRFEVISRGRNLIDAKTNAMTIFEAVAGAGGATLPVVAGGPTYRLGGITCVGAPTFTGKTQRGSKLVATFYRITLERIL